MSGRLIPISAADRVRSGERSPCAPAARWSLGASRTWIRFTVLWVVPHNGASEADSGTARADRRPRHARSPTQHRQDQKRVTGCGSVDQGSDAREDAGHGVSSAMRVKLPFWVCDAVTTTRVWVVDTDWANGIHRHTAVLPVTVAWVVHCVPSQV